jgi:hypothetical protein
VLDHLRELHKTNLRAVDFDGYTPADVATALNTQPGETRTVQPASAHYALKLLTTRGEAVEVSEKPARYRAA